MNNEIIEMWTKEGWKYSEIEDGFSFQIKFPFAKKFTRIITVYFKTKPRNYYFIEVKLVNEDETEFAYENLFVEMKEHMLIHKTLLALNWIKVEVVNESTNN